MRKPASSVINRKPTDCRLADILHSNRPECRSDDGQRDRTFGDRGLAARSELMLSICSSLICRMVGEFAYDHITDPLHYLAFAECGVIRARTNSRGVKCLKIGKLR